MGKVKESGDESLLSEAYVLMAGLRTCLAGVENKSEEDWQWLQATDHWFTKANRQMNESLHGNFNAGLTVSAISGVILAIKDKVNLWGKDERLSTSQQMALTGAAFCELLPIFEGVLDGYRTRN